MRLWYKKEEQLNFHEHSGSPPVLWGPCCSSLFFFLCCVFPFVCAHSVSCAQCCLCPWIVLRVSLTFIEVSSEPARSFLQLNELLICFHSSLPSTYTSNSVVPQGVLAPIFTNVGVLCSCSNKTTASSSVVVKEAV